MSHDTIAILFFFGGILTLIAVEIIGDVILAKTWGIDATISRSMHRTRRIVVFAFGALYGFAGGFLSAHFWWGAGSPEVDRPGVIERSHAQVRPAADRFAEGAEPQMDADERGCGEAHPCSSACIRGGRLDLVAKPGDHDDWSMGSL